MKIAICQIDTVIGDIEGNSKKILDWYFRGVSDKVDLVVFPELSLVGYAPLDLVEKQEFRNKVFETAEFIASKTTDVGLIFGSITEKPDDNVGTGIFNSALLCFNGKIQFKQDKTLIPNYDVFDERRYFESGNCGEVFEFRNEVLGISVCEDIWNDVDYWKRRRYPIDPVSNLIENEATVLINISASPYSFGKREEKREMLSVVSKQDKIPLAYVCTAGAQSELIFDGASMCFDSEGNLCLLGKTFAEDYFIFDTNEKYRPIISSEGRFEKEILDALILGAKDYCAKTGFKKVILGLSGGMDSALVTYIAVQAMGKENVHVLLMPSKYSSEGSIKDSLKLIENLGISYNQISIQSVFDEILNQLNPVFNETESGLTEENIQPRIRGMYLMALSNKFNYLVLATGNKSELAVGYSTLYGDMAGSLEVIGDVYKTDVYRIAEFINRSKEIIQNEIITKAPSAELRHNQTDQDSLPPYELLDKILKMYLEENKEYKEIVIKLGNSEIVKKVLKLVDLNEFKRKQAPPVLRVSTKAFGYGRRFPIVQGWKRNG